MTTDVLAIDLKVRKAARLLRAMLEEARPDIAEEVLGRGLSGADVVTIVSDRLGIERKWAEPPDELAARVAAKLCNTIWIKYT
jgi:hypothetical protein